MTTLSLAMIVKNEAATIERVLNCARTFCDELIVVDTGSTDNTAQLAQALGAKVYPFKWVDDFAAARNESFRHCTGEWILWLDADDVITTQQQTAFKTLKETVLSSASLDTVSTRYDLRYSPEGVCIQSTHRHRLVRRSAGIHWQYPIHECLVGMDPKRNLLRTDLVVEHRPPQQVLAQKQDRNLNILRNIYAAGDRTPRMLYYHANELVDHQQYAEARQKYEEYLDVSNGTFERYLAMIHCAACCDVLNQTQDGLAWALKAMVFDSTRAEAFIRVAQFYTRQNLWQQAIPFYTAASVLTTPPAAGHYPAQDYTWGPYDGLGACLGNLGDYPKAITMFETALNYPMATEERDRIQSNLEQLRAALK